MGEDSELNLTSLLDVIFNLLFFFILATNIRTDESYFELTLPEISDAPARKPDTQIPVIFVAKDGTFGIGDRKLIAQQLRAELRTLVEEVKVTRVILRADAEATMQQATDALSIIQESGIREIIQPVKLR